MQAIAAMSSGKQRDLEELRKGAQSMDRELQAIVESAEASKVPEGGKAITPVPG